MYIFYIFILYGIVLPEIQGALSHQLMLAFLLHSICWMSTIFLLPV